MPDKNKSNIELKREIAQLQLTIQGLTAELAQYKEVQPICFISEGTFPLTREAEHIYAEVDNKGECKIPLYCFSPSENPKKVVR